MAVLAVLSLSAQEPFILQPNHVILQKSYDPDRPAEFEFDFNADGTLSFGYCISYDEDFGEDSTAFTYYYDDERQLIKKTAIDLSKIGLCLISEFHDYWSWENHHVVKSERYQRYDYGHYDTLQRAQRILYQYDDQGFLTDRVNYHQSVFGDYYVWNPFILVMTHCERSSAQMVTTYTYPTLAYPQPNQRDTEILGPDGLPLTKLTEKMVDDVFQDSKLEEYTYSNKRLVRVERKTKENGVWQNSEETQYLRNAHGDIVQTLYNKWDGEYYVNDKRTVYERNDQGLPVFVSFEKYNDGAWEVSTPNFILDPNENTGLVVDSLFVGALSEFNSLFIKYYTTSLAIEYTQTPNPYQTIEISSDNSIVSVSPNPTTGQIIVTGQGIKSAEVFNTLGQQVATVKGKELQLTIDLANHSNGIYFVSVTDESGKKCVKKVVKQ